MRRPDTFNWRMYWSRDNSLLFTVLLALAVITFILNRPGHLSFDSVIQLYEGRTGIINSFNPPFMGFLLGLLDKIKSGAELFLVLNIGIFYVALFLFIKERHEFRIWTLISLCLICLAPVFLIYNGIIWKDVFFANLSFLGFALLATDAPRKARLMAAAFVFAMVLLARQQGPLVVLCGAWCYAMLADDKTWIQKLGRFILAFLVPYVLSKLIFWLIVYMSISIRDPSLGTGFSVLLLYDISGMVYAYGPESLTVFAKAGLDIPQMTAEIMRNYSNARVDFLSFDALNYSKLNLEILWLQWMEVVREHPFGYLVHRAKVFSWMLGFHDPKMCLPMYVGLDGPKSMIDSLGLHGLIYPHAVMLRKYAEPFFNGLLFRPWFYLLWGVIFSVSLIRNKMRPNDRALLMLLVAGIAYVASYYFFSIACDFRYAYLLVLGVSIAAAMLIPSWIGQSIRKRRKVALSS